ncbi:MAG: 2-amino-4-hydroxy-6-hydroxymethyldihydropteridine diphosphokinase [Candidatus Gastranaerophilales bacterium]|nr:2-amino-4-hydroxy-6-hydroxymethyldihydropteridine diphosphokinase [Candidatus Gastranaerophilales bacterium]
MPIAYLCLGSNIEDRVGYIQQATSLLIESKLLNLIRSSTMYETEPWGNKEQNWFLNAVIEVKTKLPPRELLTLCLDVEAKLGRKRDPNNQWCPRTVDIDILLYGNEVIEEQDLIIPHKHLHERAFALVPLLELIPDYIHPKLHKSLIDLHEALEYPEDIYLYGTRFEFNE